MNKAVMECKVCFSKELFKVTTKDTNKKLVVCSECNQVYELDENDNLIVDHDPKDVQYFKELDRIFKNWDNAKDVIPYNKNKEVVS